MVSIINRYMINTVVTGQQKVSCQWAKAVDAGSGSDKCPGGVCPTSFFGKCELQHRETNWTPRKGERPPNIV